MITLRPHQIAHADRLETVLRTRAAALDASDTGTGKTYTALEVARRMGISPLVICPKSVSATWTKVGSQMGVKVQAVGYEKARGRGGKSALGEFVAFGRGSLFRFARPVKLVIFDEVHRCGAITSLQAKLLIAARRQCGKVLLLSATAADDPVRMKALGFALDLFDLKEWKWWLFRHGVKPGVWGGFTFTEDPEVRQQVMLKLHHDLFPHRGARMRKSEIAGFPRTHIAPLLLEDADGKADRLCQEIHRLFTLRMTQASAAVEVEDGDERPQASHLEQLLRKRQALELLKVPDMVELATDYAQTSRVVLFAHFRDTLQMLREKLERALGHAVPIIDGTNADEERQSIQAAFQANNVPVLLANAEAGGIALSLHDPTGRVERTALISPGWSARQLKQVLGRVHRDGGAFSQQFLVGFAGTLEERILGVLADRADRIDLLNDGVLHGLLP